jgi:hypothetical protein
VDDDAVCVGEGSALCAVIGHRESVGLRRFWRSRRMTK